MIACSRYLSSGSNAPFPVHLPRPHRAAWIPPNVQLMGCFREGGGNASATGALAPRVFAPLPSGGGRINNLARCLAAAANLTANTNSSIALNSTAAQPVNGTAPNATAAPPGAPFPPVYGGLPGVSGMPPGAAGADGTASSFAFVALQGTQCLGAAVLPAAFMAGQQPDAACSVPCPGAQVQPCGGPTNGSVVLYTVYRVLIR